MAYKHSTGNRKFGDIIAEGDAQGNTLIDFGEDRIDFKTSGSVSFTITPTGSNFETPIQIGGQTIVSAEGNISCGAVDAGEVSASAFIITDDGTPVYTLPTSDGTDGQAIVTDGNGELSFSTISGGGGGGLDATNGANNRIATFTDSDSLNGEATLTFDGTDLTLAGNLNTSGSITHNAYKTTLYPTNLSDTGTYALQRSFVKEFLWTKYDWSDSSATSLFSVEPYDIRTGAPYNGSDLWAAVGLELAVTGHYKGAAQGNFFMKMAGAIHWSGGSRSGLLSTNMRVGPDASSWFSVANSGTNGSTLKLQYNGGGWSGGPALVHLKIYTGYGADGSGDGIQIYWVVTELFNGSAE